jgi:hypothetical protein
MGYFPTHKLHYLLLNSAFKWLREEHRLRVFENRMLRRIFGPKRGEATGGWRKLHNEELYNLYSSPNISSISKSRRIRSAGRVSCSEGDEKCLHKFGWKT